MVVATFTQMVWKLIEIIFVWVYIPLIINDIAINIIYLKWVEDFSPICTSESYDLQVAFMNLRKVNTNS